VTDPEGSRKETLAFWGMETELYVDDSPHFATVVIPNGTYCVRCDRKLKDLTRSLSARKVKFTL
jgi:hypothetical protein